MQNNIEKSKKYALYVIKKCGTAPVVPHFYALFLDDSVEEERSLAIKAGISLLMMCDELWVFGDVISDGMKEEIRMAKILNIRVRYVSENEMNMKEN